MPFVTARDGTNLFCRRWAEGPPVVLCHSWAVNSDIWRPLMAQLASMGFQPIAYDRRGHGRSDDAGRGYDFDTLADDLASVIEALDLRDTTLVGHSMGSAEIVRYLSRHGDGRVARVVMTAPALPFAMKTADNPTGWVDPSGLEAMWSQWRLSFTAWLVAAAPSAFEAGAAPALIDQVMRMMLGTSLEAVIACNAVGSKTDFRPELARISTPTLILHGDADMSCPLDAAGRETARLLTNASLKIVPGATHTLIIERAAEVADDIAAFVREGAPAKVAA
ncbi:MAG: alpha/beta fold hydrolase [Caulobacteraceae bacterium]